MKQKKIKSVYSIYMKNFIRIIVIPIIIIGMLAMSILLNQSHKAIETNMKLVEKNIVDLLESEINNTSIQFSSFLLINDNKILDSVSRYNIEKGSKRYEYQELVKTQFNLLSIPKLQLIGFYMDNNNEFFIKNYFTLTREELEDREWYKKASTIKDEVYIAIEDESIILDNRESENPEKLILFCFSPNKYNYLDQIEISVMCIKSEAIKLIESANTWSDSISVFLVDSNNNILVKSDENLVQEALEVLQGKDNNSGYRYSITNINKTDLKLVSITKDNFMTKGYEAFFVMIILAIFIIFLLFYLFSNRFIRNIMDPLETMVKGMEKIDINNTLIFAQNDAPYEIKVIQTTFNKMVKRIRNLIKENKVKEAQKHKEELKALQLQMNPHFLSNTLTTIRFMAQVAKYDGIRKMTESLIKILDCSFRSDKRFHSLIEEIEMLNSYLYIMKIRYANNFEVKINIDEQCNKALIPKLILQPLIENAIVHGFEEKDDIGHIWLNINKNDNSIKFCIKDDGKGIDETKIKSILNGKSSEGNRIGVSNIYNRLFLYYKDNFSFIIKSEKNLYTEIEIIIPYIKTEEEYDNV